MFYSDDPARDFDRHDREQAKRLAELPVCDVCDDPIQEDFYFEINGENICECCMDRFFKKENHAL